MQAKTLKGEEGEEGEEGGVSQHDAVAQQNKRRQAPTLHAPCELMYDGARLDQTGVTIHRLTELDAASNDGVDWCTRPEVARSSWRSRCRDDRVGD